MANPEAPRSPDGASPSNPLITRRRVLGGMAGVAGLAAVPSLIAACSPAASTAPAASTGGAPSAAPSSGGGASASAALRRPAPSRSAATTPTPARRPGWSRSTPRSPQATGIDVKMNTVDHGTFQDQIQNYLGGTPDTAYTWFSGFRMKFFADQGLNVAIDDVWAKVKDNYTEGFANSVVGNDGKVYGIPVDYYPWAVFYRKSVFADKGYTIPATWDDLKTLADEDEGRRPDPDRLRRQGRLARDGHVRHPQPPAQRVRLPRQPDGRQGEVDGPEGHRRSSRSGRRSCRSTPRTTPA